MRDVTETLELFEELTEEQKTVALEMLRVILNGSDEQLRAG